MERPAIVTPSAAGQSTRRVFSLERHAARARFATQSPNAAARRASRARGSTPLRARHSGLAMAPRRLTMRGPTIICLLVIMDHPLTMDRIKCFHKIILFKKKYLVKCTFNINKKRIILPFLKKMPHLFFGSRSGSKSNHKGKCPEGKTRDRATKRCRAKYQTGILPRTPCSPGKVRDTETKRCRERLNKAKSPCPSGKTRDASTGRCREKYQTGILPRTPCSPGKVRDPKTKHCRERLNKAKSPCPPGKTRDASTGRCREKYQTGILPRTPCSPGKVRDTKTKHCRSPRKAGPKKAVSRTRSRSSRSSGSRSGSSSRTISMGY